LALTEINQDNLLRDHLAIDRSELANERTLLAYIRTSLALFLTGISGVHLPGLGEGTMFGPGYRVAGWVFIGAATLVISVGYSAGLWRITPGTWRSLKRGSPPRRPAGIICTSCVGRTDSGVPSAATGRLGPSGRSTSNAHAARDKRR